MMKHPSNWKKASVLIGLVAAAIVARAVAPDVKRYVRIKSM